MVEAINQNLYRTLSILDHVGEAGKSIKTDASSYTDPQKKTLKIVAFSDLHGNEEYLERVYEKITKEQAEVALCCGDFGRKFARRVFKKFQNEKIKFYFVTGNHDCRKIRKVSKSEKIECINNKIVQYKGLHLVGMGLPTHRWTNFKYKRNFRKLLQKAVDYENVLVVTHYGRREDRKDKRWKKLRYLFGRGHHKVKDWFIKKYSEKHGYEPTFLEGHDHGSKMRHWIPMYCTRSGKFNVDKYYYEKKIKKQRGTHNAAFGTLSLEFELLPVIQEEEKYTDFKQINYI